MYCHAMKQWINHNFRASESQDEGIIPICALSKFRNNKCYIQMSCNGNHITNLWSRNKALAVVELIKGDN